MTTDQSAEKPVKKKFSGSRFSCWILFILLAASLLLLFPITRKIHHYQTELEGVRHQIAQLNDENVSKSANSIPNAFEALKDFDSPDQAEATGSSETAAVSNESDSVSVDRSFNDQSFSNGQNDSNDQSNSNGLTISNGLGEQRVMRNKMSRFSSESMPSLSASGGSAKSRSSLISELLNKSEAGQARMERWGRAFRILRTGIIILGFMLIYCIYISRQREEDLPQDAN